MAFRLPLDAFAALARLGKPGDVARGIVLRALNGGPVESATDTRGSVSRAKPPPGCPTLETLARSQEEARRVLNLPLPPGVLLERVRKVLGVEP